MNNWLKLALISFLGLIVSIVALGVLKTDDAANGMNMGVTSNQSMVMGPSNMSSTNMPITNMGPGKGIYNYYPGQWGKAVMWDKIPYWVKHRLNTMPMHNINMNQMPMQNNMNMQGNMGQM